MASHAPEFSRVVGTQIAVGRALPRQSRGGHGNAMPPKYLPLTSGYEQRLAYNMNEPIPLNI
jgi:hypothetical protein